MTNIIVLDIIEFIDWNETPYIYVYNQFLVKKKVEYRVWNIVSKEIQCNEMTNTEREPDRYSI